MIPDIMFPTKTPSADSRPAIDAFFFADGRPTIDALVSLTGFSLVGGPAYNDAKAAEDVLARLDVPYLGVTPVEFQTLDQWGESSRGLLPVESTMMVAIPTTPQRIHNGPQGMTTANEISSSSVGTADPNARHRQ